MNFFIYSYQIDTNTVSLQLYNPFYYSSHKTQMVNEYTSNEDENVSREEKKKQMKKKT